ncbi:MAG: 2-amino-3-ketobutyrate CoA ligase [Bacteroidetes bacterium 4484_249]|nr:MAG: 2-amino-3-ketobutyrate CoA ligase [Bacteroidetes bacterium 4484_249]
MEPTLKAKSLKDFEDVKNASLGFRANLFYDYYLQNTRKKHSNYRIISKNGSGAKITVIDPYSKKEIVCISFVSNDYLGFTKHHKVINAGKDALDKFGSGSGSSPLIGGYNSLHDELEKKIARFFKKEDSITYTSGYAANTGTIMALLKNQDLAILDMGVHASVLEGCALTNKKFFLHNDVSSLEQVLNQTKGKFRNTAIIIDGVYSQDGDIAPIQEIVSLAKEYNAFLIVDDAHGVGVVGNKGKGVLEMYNLYDEVDMITGTFSKTFATVGGYVAANKKIITLLKYFAYSNIFSAAATPQAVSCAIKAIDLLDEEPEWHQKLKENIKYFRNGLDTIGIDYGNTESAIFPIMIRDEEKTKIAGRLLFVNGIYANPILYPAVSRKQTRIRMSVLATHTKIMLDESLNTLEDILKKVDVL